MSSTTSYKQAPAPPADASPGQQRAGPRILEIDGLRGIAIALIVVYHIWLNRVSGGVDVFLLLSGFLITMTIARSVSASGRVPFARFYIRIARRIFPPALFVLVAVVGMSILWIPQIRWREVLGDVVAAALQVVNWRLAENAVDYLASQSAASPVQHYWSLAIQSQFYLLWPLLIGAAAVIATKLALQPRRTLTVLLTVIFVGSLTYSIYRTWTNQPYAYFDTFARLWEFALGGLLFIALPHLRVRGLARVIVGWVGLIALLVCGLVFRAGDVFPGWAALWPTLAAAMLIVTAGGDSPYGADRLLRHNVLRWLGKHAYALYLWHWPVLICYLAGTDLEQATLRGGVLVIVASLLLSIASRWLLEERIRHWGFGERTTVGGVVLTASFLTVVMLATAGWAGRIHHEQQQLEAAAATPERTSRMVTAYPGGAYLVHGGELADVPYRPGPIEVRDERPTEPECHQNQQDSDVIACEYGVAEGDRTIAIVGGSRARHWLPALEVAAERQNWRLISITKSSCLFSAEMQLLNGEPYTSCYEWNHNVVEELSHLQPDVIFTTSTYVTRDDESTPEGYIAHWWALENLNLDVLAIRDVPRWEQDVPECVERYGPHSPRCTADPTIYGLDQPAPVTSRPDIPQNVDFIDLTDFFCFDGHCPPVIGNVLVYYDRNHITVTYARTLGPFVEEQILAATGW